jgi:hypothetical protein
MTMVSPTEAMAAAKVFARAVIRKKWLELSQLFASAAQFENTPEYLEAAFGWKRLGPKLRQMHIDITGEDEEMVPELDPPKRYEMFEVEERDLPVGHDLNVPLCWVEIDFQPSEDSEFDQCYNCFLAFIDEGGPRVTAYAIESATE